MNKKISPISFGYILYPLIIQYIVLILANLMGEIAAGLLEFPVVIGANLILIPIMAVIYRKDGNCITINKLPGSHTFFYLIMIVSASVLWNIFLNSSGILKFFPLYQDVETVLYSGNIITELVGLAMIVPVAEELVFRGIFYERIKQFTKTSYAMIITAFMFAVYHGNVIQGVYAGLFSLLFTLMKERTKTITAPILAHMAVNGCSLILTEYGLLQNGSQGRVGIACIVIIVMCTVIEIRNKVRQFM